MLKNYFQRIGFTVNLLLFSFSTMAQPALENILHSPDGNINVEIRLNEKIYYTVSYKGVRVLEASPLTLTIKGNMLGANPVVRNVSRKIVDDKITTLWGGRKVIHDHYNLMELDFGDNFSVQFRAYNTGVAYRFVTKFKEKNVTVNDEEVAYRFGFNVPAWTLNGTYESSFRCGPLDFPVITKMRTIRDKIFLPVVVEPTSHVRILITEAGLRDYPVLFLSLGRDFENYLQGTFEKYVLTTKTGGFSNYSRVVDKEADYIALTDGARAFPWRLMIISDDDRVFPDNDLVYQLSEPSQLEDTGWIKPGKVAWDWWHDYVVENQPFRGGINTETYLYQVDFASKYGIEYIIIDWMWTDKNDLTLFNPDVNLKRIVDYGAKKGVRVIVWCPGHTVHRQLDKALDLFASYGVAGIKADFFGHEDQTGINMYEDIARAAAKRKLVVDFHGCTKPTGLTRTYPNILNYEAVAGNEYNKLEDLATSAHKVMLPFTRGAIGPMDYTPGGMQNVQSGHAIRYTLPMVHGTRCNEMALYVIYNEPLKMVCDAPSVYEREPVITRFFTSIPTVWDETKVLLASFGKFLVSARKTGNTWYVAGMTGTEEKEVTIGFHFLDNGKYKAVILKDGPNADRVGTDYLFEEMIVDRETELSILMAKGGGFVISVTPSGQPAK